MQGPGPAQRRGGPGPGPAPGPRPAPGSPAPRARREEPAGPAPPPAVRGGRRPPPPPPSRAGREGEARRQAGCSASGRLPGGGRGLRLSRNRGPGGLRGGGEAASEEEDPEFCLRKLPSFLRGRAARPGAAGSSAPRCGARAGSLPRGGAPEQAQQPPRSRPWPSAGRKKPPSAGCRRARGEGRAAACPGGAAASLRFGGRPARAAAVPASAEL